MSEQRAPYRSDAGEQLSPKPAEETLREIKEIIAKGEQAHEPASHILERIFDVLKGQRG